MTDPIPPYNVGDLGGAARRKAPAVARNTPHILEVLREWLPSSGTVLEIASGTGEHALAFARAFPALEWQPSDPDPLAMASIEAWRAGGGPDNLGAPMKIDVNDPWPVDRADAVLCINMVHISPPESSLGLLDGAARILPSGAPLILYGPWIEAGVPVAPSNLAFDESLKARDPRWGLRVVEEFADLASARGLILDERRAMPSNNLMLKFVRE